MNAWILSDPSGKTLPIQRPVFKPARAARPSSGDPQSSTTIPPILNRRGKIPDSAICCSPYRNACAITAPSSLSISPHVRGDSPGLWTENEAPIRISPGIYAKFTVRFLSWLPMQFLHLLVPQSDAGTSGRGSVRSALYVITPFADRCKRPLE